MPSDSIISHISAGDYPRCGFVVGLFAIASSFHSGITITCITKYFVSNLATEISLLISCVLIEIHHRISLPAIKYYSVSDYLFSYFQSACSSLELSWSG